MQESEDRHVVLVPVHRGDSVSIAAYIYSIRAISENFYIIPFAAPFSPMVAVEAEFWNVLFAQG